MNWKQNKTLFNYIMNKQYIIKKKIETNNILYIKWENFEMKCKYFLIFSVDSYNNILWSCNNPFIDQKTRYFSNYFKLQLGSEKKFNENLTNNLKKIIQNNSSILFEDEKINFLWCIIGNYKEYTQFYIITEIIYL